jgi:hypothetical protein
MSRQYLYDSVAKNLLLITKHMWYNITQLMMRGETLQDLEVQSEYVLETSEQFVQRVTPWYIQCLHVCEYWSCYLCSRRKQRKL